MEKPDGIMQGNRPEEVLFLFDPKNGRPRRVEAYHTTRAGISWPGLDSPGYFCIFGLKDERTFNGKKPLELLDEYEHPILDDFFERLVIRTKKNLCAMALANLGNYPGFDDSLRRFVNERKMDSLRPYDSSEFENLNHATVLINQKLREGSLIVPKETILARQLGSITPEDVREKPEERFYAVMALVRLIGSFEYYPWRKNSSNSVRFTNISSRSLKTKADDEEYIEFTS
jgi:hypothetical protein